MHNRVRDSVLVVSYKESVSIISFLTNQGKHVITVPSCYGEKLQQCISDERHLLLKNH